MFILLIATLALSGAAMAQAGFQDILGPHNLNGHGCATCHTPHTGAQGNGGTNASTGTNYLWGRDFFPNSYTTSEAGRSSPPPRIPKPIHYSTRLPAFPAMTATSRSPA